MATKNFSITAEEMEARISHAVRCLSRKKFTEKQLRQFIVNGKVPNETKRTKSGYQLFLDDFRKDLTKEERSNVGKVAKDGSAQWADMSDEDKQPYLDQAAELKAAAQADLPPKEKKPRGRPKKNSDDEDNSDSPDENPEEDSNDEDQHDEVPEPPKKSKKKKTDDENDLEKELDKDLDLNSDDENTKKKDKKKKEKKDKEKKEKKSKK